MTITISREVAERFVAASYDDNGYYYICGEVDDAFRKALGENQ